MRARLLAVALLLASSGCAGRRAAKQDAAAAKKAADAAAAAALAGPVDVDEASLRGKDFVASVDLKTAYFPYDSASIDDEAKAVLRANAEWLSRNPQAEVQVQGHCDERGTTEYNLALGQRRAKAVREYYRALGVRGSRMSTISFGEEKPACSEATEDCWRKNRRSETLLKRVPKK